MIDSIYFLIEKQKKRTKKKKNTFHASMSAAKFGARPDTINFPGPGPCEEVLVRLFAPVLEALQPAALHGQRGLLVLQGLHGRPEEKTNEGWIEKRGGVLFGILVFLCCSFFFPLSPFFLNGGFRGKLWVCSVFLLLFWWRGRYPVVFLSKENQ